jgi:hypothetical protein
MKTFYKYLDYIGAALPLLCILIILIVFLLVCFHSVI